MIEVTHRISPIDIPVTILHPGVSVEEFSEVKEEMLTIVNKTYYRIPTKDIIDIIVRKPRWWEKILFGRGTCSTCGKETIIIGFRYYYQPNVAVGKNRISITNQERLAWCRNCGTLNDLQPAPSD